MLVPGLSVPCLGEIETPAWSDPPDISTCQSTLSDPLFNRVTTWVCWPESQPNCTLVGATWSQPALGVALGAGDGVVFAVVVADIPVPAAPCGDGAK